MKMKSLISSFVLFFSIMFVMGYDDGVASDAKKEADPLSSEYFVNASWLNKNSSSENIVILDARGSEDAYIKRHIPRAFLTKWINFVDSTDTKVVGHAELSEHL